MESSGYTSYREIFMQFCIHAASRRALSGLFVLAVWVVAVSMTASNARAADADLSTPKKAAAAFAKAVQEGDIDAMKSAATGTNEQLAAMKNVADLFGGIRRYEAAAIKKFGDGGKLPAEAKVDLVSEVEKSDEKVEGDKATLIDKTKPDEKHPMTLKKDGANWKVNLSEADPKMMEMRPKARKAADAIDAVIKGVEAGKYKTAIEALGALGEVMQSLNG
jgi:hypothetical protein